MFCLSFWQKWNYCCFELENADHPDSSLGYYMHKYLFGDLKQGIENVAVF